MPANSPDVFELLLQLLIILIPLGCGVSLIFGTIKKWPMLVDPPEKMWTYYSHSLLKKFFGKKFLIYYNYLLGCIFFSLGFYGLTVTLRKIYKVIIGN